jgi:hypothetical protein
MGDGFGMTRVLFKELPDMVRKGLAATDGDQAAAWAALLAEIPELYIELIAPWEQPEGARRSDVLEALALLGYQVGDGLSQPLPSGKRLADATPAEMMEGKRFLDRVAAGIRITNRAILKEKARRAAAERKEP